MRWSYLVISCPPSVVRRLKQDLREIGEAFPQRQAIPIVIDNLPDDAPELQLSHLLQEYRNLREERLKVPELRG